MKKYGTSAKLTLKVAQRSLNLASVRYRGLLPGIALKRAGWFVCCVSGIDDVPTDTEIAFAIKPLSEGDAKWIRTIAAREIPVVVDLCDNVFTPGYGGSQSDIAERFRSTARLAAAIVVPTSALAEVLKRELGHLAPPVFVVPDIVETPELIKSQRDFIGNSSATFQARITAWVRRARNGLGKYSRKKSGPKRLLWFGNHGASYADYGISDILIFSEALESLASERDVELWVVSNSREKYEKHVGPLQIRSRYFEWNEDCLDKLLPLVDICIVPNSLDEFSKTKSANRALKALAHGIPVVATETSAYEMLREAVWLGDPLDGMRAYINEMPARKRHLDRAKEILADQYSMNMLSSKLSEIFYGVLHANRGNP